ncbi:hypothetical protein GCM10010495_52310 [Kitasatospora herbaricolor]|nr:hypothetical protein GCM10010495_52310 [Kitasatospora herbaricolor]
MERRPEARGGERAGGAHEGPNALRHLLRDLAVDGAPAVQQVGRHVQDLRLDVGGVGGDRALEDAGGAGRLGRRHGGAAAGE